MTIRNLLKKRVRNFALFYRLSSRARRKIVCHIIKQQERYSITYSQEDLKPDNA